MPNRSSRKKGGNFKFLLDLAKKLGATDAKIVGSDKIAVENRVLLKCRSGCATYGHKLVCPPFTPSPDEFRKMLKEYDKVLVVKFKGEAEADEETGRNLSKGLCTHPDVPQDLREHVKKFWEAWNADKRRILLKMLELEKAAFNQGYTLALALTAGSCTLCEKCNVTGNCVYPTMARLPEHSLGVNVKKTLKNIGMPIKFPFEKNPECVGILLID